MDRGRAPAARAGDRARRRRPGVGASTSPTSRRRAPRPASRASTTGSPQDVEHAEVEALLRELNDDARVSGILLQLPTPPQVDGGALTELIAPYKDVDGLTPMSAGLLAKGRPGLRPCTPAGVMELLRRHDVDARRAPRPWWSAARTWSASRSARCCWPRNATVTTCHSRTRDLAEVCRRADVLVAAVGVPELVRGDWVKEGAVVIDVGINRTDDGLRGDVEFAAARERARLITPVPGGVGPMTIAMLLRNTLEAARHAGRPCSACASVSCSPAPAASRCWRCMWAPWYDGHERAGARSR